jgi:hypothetical protein
MTRVDRIALALYLCVAVALGFMDHRSRRFPDHPVTKYIPGVVDGSYGAPAIYRPLSPFVIDRFIAFSGWEPLVAFLAVRLVVIYLALAAIHWYLRVLPLTFTNSWAHPDSFPELVIMAVGCRLIATAKDGWLAVVIFVGMLNRETAAFLAVLWGVDRLRRERSSAVIVRAAGYATICAGVYVGMRLLRGYQSYDVWMLWQNLALLRPLPAGFDPYVRVVGYFWMVLLLIPALVAGAALRKPGTPSFFVSATLVSALMLGVAFSIAAIGESRVLLPIVPMLLPVVTWGVVDASTPGAHNTR